MSATTTSPPRPSDSELAILQVLWEHGPCTVRQVHEVLERDTGYTTVMKLMQIMAEKGLVERDEENRAHLYHAAVKQETVEKGLVRRMLDNAFSGSAARLAMRALSTKKPSAEELAELRELIDSLEKGGRS
ncbi:MAG: BlaI/MecI/CopY family transcriptional regulator [Verrucomicrobiaceae bacterium]|nr:BlaI/MecI/CopY family transcriptional regulator [Verrucomicrobiaceae bacterium]